MLKNYTLGKGEIYFGRFLPGTETPEGERYIGNTPEFNLTVESENLDHFNADRGIREKDDSVTLEVSRTGSLITDNIAPDNIALFFLGSASVLSVSSQSVAAEPLNDVKKGYFYQLGASAGRPSGVRGIVYPGTGPTLFAVKKGATTLVAGTDYALDATLGRIEILEGGSIVEGDDLTVDYSIAAHTRHVAVSQSESVRGSLRYIARNPKGEQFDYFMPYVELRPNGDFVLKGEEWQQIPFTVEVLKKGSLEAVYIDGQKFLS